MLSVGFGLASLVLLALICPRVRIGSPVHRAMQRGVAALGIVTAFSLLPGARVGVNAVSVACVGALGLPGLGLLHMITLMV